ncbi:MAG: hypothetical protein RL108_298 [Bacteroidota bacterium]|jgi:hypothetical protein
MNMKNINLETSKKITPGFQIPEGYFDTFSEKLLQELPLKEMKTISFYTQNKKWIYAAAAVLVIMLSLPLVYQLERNQEQPSAAEIENYLTQQSPISEDEIVNLLEQEDIDQLKTNSTITNEAIEEELSAATDLEKYITN